MGQPSLLGRICALLLTADRPRRGEWPNRDDYSVSLDDADFDRWTTPANAGRAQVAINAGDRVLIVGALGCALALAVLALAARAQEAAPSAAPDKDDAAKQRYELLLEKVEGDGRSCVISKSSDSSIEALKNFVREIQFVEVDRDKPIVVVLPESYYHPRGRTLTFDRFELTVNRENPGGTYISLTRTDEGLLIEPKFALSFEDGRMFCVRGVSATKAYER
jgi:hypothetical protein